MTRLEILDKIRHDLLRVAENMVIVSEGHAALVDADRLNPYADKLDILYGDLLAQQAAISASSVLEVAEEYSRMYDEEKKSVLSNPSNITLN